MRTTVTIDEALYRKVKERAASSGRTVSQVIGDALRESLRTRPRTQERRELPVSGGSGVLPGIDLADNAAVRDAMDAAVTLDALR